MGWAKIAEGVEMNWGWRDKAFTMSFDTLWYQMTGVLLKRVPKPQSQASFKGTVMWLQLLLLYVSALDVWPWGESLTGSPDHSLSFKDTFNLF